MTGSRRLGRVGVAGALALAALFVLHHDFWNWHEPGRFLGLPSGLAYHVGYCLAASALFAWLVRRSAGGPGPR